MRTIKYHLSIFLFLALAGVVRAEDVCEKLIPAPLQEIVLKKYPDYRIVKSTDRITNDPYWDKHYYKKGECLAVASADFDGDKINDFAFFIVMKNSKKPKLIAALSRDKQWSIEELPIWNERIEGCYVETMEPGTYEHTKSFDFMESNNNERAKITSKNTSIIAGKVESTGVVYVYEKGRWLYVWVSD